MRTMRTLKGWDMVGHRPTDGDNEKIIAGPMDVSPG